jgi:hypothetical protein
LRYHALALLVKVFTHQVKFVFPLSPYTRRVYLVSLLSYRQSTDARQALTTGGKSCKKEGRSAVMEFTPTASLEADNSYGTIRVGVFL